MTLNRGIGDFVQIPNKEKRDMRIVCAWCGKIIKEGTGEPDENVSHGICTKCAKVEKEEIGAMRKEGKEGKTTWFLS